MGKNKKKKPLVSIITPHFNNTDLFEVTLKSIKEQTYKNIEHVVVDDGSRGEELIALQKLQEKYGFTLEILPENRGVSFARTTAAVKSKGEYILPLDADGDNMQNNYVERLVETAVALGSSFSPFYSDVELFGEMKQNFERPAWSVRGMLAGPGHTPTNSSLYSREAFEAVGSYDSGLGIWVDMEFWISMMLKGYKGYKVDETKFFYNIRKKSVSDHFDKVNGATRRQQAWDYICVKHKL